ncbi:uncharacterized protein LOC130895677 isoform X2 [Diorhabda carinulata]|uniref:uncharacterized protein LOC130895677 isoform X2 n=1 Tax=Diorhabda carinulata TaxID=1163345 RepID=UPI0025A0B534|nr:uncharacterized protein LOC130895677 isoform X2 [Diorhabda carinulata]
MKFNLFLLLVAISCYFSITEGDELDHLKNGLNIISAKPEKIVDLVANTVNSRAEENNHEIIMNIIGPIATLVKNIILVIDQLVTFQFPNGSNFHEIIHDALIFGLNLFVGKNKLVMETWTKLVDKIFMVIELLYNHYMPLIYRVAKQFSVQ